MDICNIGGKEYAVIVLSIKETFTKLYTEDTGRTMSEGAEMSLNCLGTFYGHQIEVARRKGFEEEFDELYELVSAPTNEGIPVKMVHNQTSIEYDAYISSGERKVKKIDTKKGMVYWDAFPLNIIPMKAQRTI